MTREEAIDIVRQYECCKEHYEACELLIKLSEPCEDAVSRQAALRQAINAHKMAQENGFDFKDICEEYLNVLPPVNPQQKHEDVAKAFQLGVAFGFGEKHDEMDKVIEEVKKAIEPKPKTGRWINLETNGQTYPFWSRYKCSVCGGYSENSDFCPHCGTRMVEPQESEVKE